MHRGYYAIIPANIRYDKEIPPNAKLLFGEITALCNEKGYCWATNSYFSDLYGVSKVSISKWISKLAEKGYITSEIQYKEGTKEILNRYLRIVNGPIKEKLNTPIKEKFKDNNTSFNTTFNNTATAAEPSAFRFYEQNFGIISPHISEQISNWLDDYNDDHSVIIYAMKITLERNSRQWHLINSILKDWHTKGAKTLSDCEALQREFKNRKGGRAYQSRQNAGSNHRDEFEDYSL